MKMNLLFRKTVLMLVLFLGLLSFGVNNVAAQNALNFNGTNSYVNCNNNAALQLSTGTIEAWLNTTNAGTSYRGIVAKPNAYGLFLVGNVLTLYDWGSSTAYSTNKTINDGKWHHVALSFVSGVANNALVYLDGVLVGTYKLTVSNQTNPLFIGAGGTSNGQIFLGNIQDVRIWNTVQTALQISSTYNCAPSIPQTGLVAYYSLNQGTASGSNAAVTTAIDATGNNNGTLNNFALSGSTGNWVAANGGVFLPSLSNTAATACLGVATLSLSNGTAATSLNWYNGATLVSSSSSPVTTTYSPIAAGSYTVVAASSAGCSVTTNAVTVTDNVTPSITISANTTNIISGASVTFTATPTNGGAAPTYQWQKGGTNISGATAATFTYAPLNGDVITCILTANNSCQTVAKDTSDPITVTVSTPAPSNALNVNAANSYITVPYNASFIMPSNTVQLWVKPTYTTLAYSPCLVANRNASSANWAYHINQTHTSLVYWNGTTVLTFNYNFIINTWYHVAFVQNGSSLTAYVNGISLGTQSVSPSGTTGLPLTIGGDLAGEGLIGNIQDVRIWNKALTATQISTTYQCPLSLPQTGLLAYYPLNEGTASGSNAAITTAIDATGNGYNGTLTNFALSGSTSNWVAANGGFGPSVTNAAVPAGAICAGTAVTYTATPTNGGSSPTYQWFKNGSAISGATAATYTFTPSNNDSIYVVLTNASTCSVAISASSLVSAVTVTANVTPSVTISATTTNIISGTSITFTATPTNGGAAPTYQWQKGGTNISGATAATYTYAPLNGDVITCILTANNSCQTVAKDTSDPITVTVSTHTPSNALNVNAANSYITVPYNASFIMPNHTVELWIKPTYSSLAYNVCLVANRNASSANWAYHINGTHTALLYWNGSKLLTYNYTFSTNTWYHVAFVQSGTSLTAYVNGTSIGVQTVSPSGTTGYPLTIGGDLANEAFIGNIQDVRIWNKALTSTEIGNYQCPLSLPQTGLLAYYPLNEGTANGSNAAITTAVDATGNGFNGTLTNFTLSGSTSNWVAANGGFGPSVTVAAVPAGAVCAGTPVTFTATPTNGGTAPTYQWFNGSIAISGATATTYTYTPTNNDSISVLLTNTTTCAVATTATSAVTVAAVTTGTPFTPSVSIVTSNQFISAGTSVTFTATASNVQGTPSYQWKKNGTNVGSNSATYTDAALANKDAITVIVTSSNPCATTTATSNSIVESVCPVYTPANITTSGSSCSAFSGQTLAPNGTLNGAPKWSYTDMFTFNLYWDGTKWLYVQSGYSVGYYNTNGSITNLPSTGWIYNGGGNCSGSLTLSGSVGSLTTPLPTASISGTATACGTVSLTASGGSSYIWNGGSDSLAALNTFTTSGTYTVRAIAANGCTATTSKVVTISPQVTPSVSILASPSGAINTGTSVTFTASPTNGGTTPTYKWIKSGFYIVGATSATYTYSPANGDLISVEMTANNSCQTIATVVSNTITETVNAIAPTFGALSLPSVSNQSAPFTLTAPSSNSAGAFTYSSSNPAVATVNGNTVTIVGAGTATITATQAADGAYESGSVSAVLTVQSCSNQLYNDVSISGTYICDGTYTYNGIVNGTNSWVFNDDQYMIAFVPSVNGGLWSIYPIGEDPINNSIALNYSHSTNLPVTDWLGQVGDFPIFSISGGTAGAVTKLVTAVITGTATACDIVTLTASGGTSYSWNGGNNGTTSATNDFTKPGTNTYKVVVSNAIGCKDSASQVVTILGPSVTPQVSMYPTPGNIICGGTSVTFATNKVYGGTAPIYNFKVNGISVQNSAASTYTGSNFNDGDVVTCELTANNTCQKTATATSNSIPMTVTPNVTPSISIVANTTFPITAGNSVTFTATPSNGGTAPTYQWLKNGKNISGATSLTYTYSPVNGDIISVLITNTTSCSNNKTVQSNEITASVLANPTIGSLALPVLVNTQSAPFTLTDPTSNSAGAFTYSSSDNSVATISGNTVTIVGAGQANIIATQAANGNYISGSVSAILTVESCVQTEPNKQSIIISGSNNYWFNGTFTYFSGSPTTNKWLSSPSILSDIDWDGTKWVVRGYFDNKVYYSNTTGSSSFIPATGWVDIFHNGNITLSGGGLGNTFISTNLKLVTASISRTATSCNSVSLTANGGTNYTWSGGNSTSTAANTFNTSGTYKVVVSNAIGCKDSATQVVTLNQPTTATLTQSATGSYTWHGTRYTESGSYTFDSLNAGGCDSLTTLNLTIIQYAPGNFSYNSPDSFTVGTAITPLVPTFAAYSTLASGFSATSRIAVDAIGNVFVADPSTPSVSKIAQNGTITTIGKLYTNYKGIAVDALDNVYVTAGYTRFGKITSNGAISMIDPSAYADAVAVDTNRNIYVLGNTSNSLKKIATDGTITQIGSGSGGITNIAVDAAGNNVYAVKGNGLIYKITNSVRTVFYQNNSASFNGVTVDATGNVYAADANNTGITRISSDGIKVDTIGSGLSTPYSVGVDATGNIYVLDATGAVKKITEAGAVSNYSISPSLPNGLSFDPFTGIISGTPTLPSAVTIYTVTASNDAGITTDTLSIQIGLGSPTISTLNLPIVSNQSAPFTLTDPTSNSIGTFTYTSSNPAVATVNGNTVTIVGAGTATITATQAADGTYTSGSVSSVLTVVDCHQTYTASNVSIDGFTVASGGYADPTFFYHFNGIYTPNGLMNGNQSWVDSAAADGYIRYIAWDGTNWTITFPDAYGQNETIATNATGSFNYLPATGWVSNDPSYGTPVLSGGIGVVNSKVIVAIAGNATDCNTVNLTATGGVNYHWNGGDYDADDNNYFNTSGTYQVVVTNAIGCSDSLSQVVVVKQPTKGATIYQTATGSSYTWYGNTYTNSGLYTFDTLNVAGCDSTITLNLTINKEVAPAFSYATPNTFTAGTAISPLIPTTVAAGNINTIASGFNALTGVAVDKAGNVYAASQSQGIGIIKIAPNGSISSFDTTVKLPWGLACDSTGNVYAASYYGPIYKFTPSGVKSVITTAFNNPTNIAVDAANNLYVVDQTTRAFYKVAPNGNTTTVFSTPHNPYGVAVDAAGNVYTSVNSYDDGTDTLYKIATDGTITSLYVGVGTYIYTVTVDAAGNVYFSEDGTVKQITPLGSVTTIASGFSYVEGIALDASNNIYISDFDNKAVVEIAADGTINNYSISPALPNGLSIDSTTGIISGTPSSASAATDYTVSAIKNGGTVKEMLNIAVLCVPTTATITQTAAGTYTWHGTTYTKSGTYTFDSLNIAGCDSLTTLQLTITTIAPTIQPLNLPAVSTQSAPFVLTNPTSNSAGVFTYTSSNTAVATVSGNTITIVGAGTATITATQAANGIYSSGSVSAVLTVQNCANVPANIVASGSGSSWVNTTYTLAGLKNGVQSWALSSVVSIYWDGSIWVYNYSGGVIFQNTTGSSSFFPASGWTATPIAGGSTPPKFTGGVGNIGTLVTASIAGTATACNSVSLTATGGTNYAWSGGNTTAAATNTFTTSGTYKVVVSNAIGCKDSATKVVIVNQPTTSNTSITACASYTWNGTTYNASGTYTKAGFKNAKGCDSTATLVLTITPKVLPSVSITASATSICAGSRVTFTATPTNGGTTPIFVWIKNGVTIVRSSGNTYSDVSLNNGDTVVCSMISNAGCVTTTTVVSNSIVFSVTKNIVPSVSISTDSTTVCVGTNVTFTANVVNGGASPTYYWKKNGVAMPSTGQTISSKSFNNNDSISCVIASNATCVTTPYATSNVIPLTVTYAAATSVSIVADSTAICNGSKISFTATAIYGGTAPFYLWIKNKVNVVGTNNPVYSDYGLNNGDSINCFVTSNALCTIATAKSNTIGISVTQKTNSTVSITASSTAICTGSKVTFTAVSTNGGIAPIYVWQKNGVNIVGGSGVTYSDAGLVNGDIINCVLYSSQYCSVTPVTSNALTISVAQKAVPSVSVAANAPSVCAGTSVIFTATPIHGGSSPSYSWKKNGVTIAGATSATYADATLTSASTIACTIVSNASCITVATASSNTASVVVTNNVVPSVSIAASSTTICAGTKVTFTATATNGGASPSYQWKKNGVSISGATSATYIDSTLNNAAIISCAMASSITCITNPLVASNNITMTVNAIPDTAVTIAATSTSICTGTKVTFTATPINGGTTIGYVWKKNSEIVQSSSVATYSDAALNNNDVISCVMTGNLVCAAPAISNSLTIAVAQKLVPSVTVSATSTNICTGTRVTFTATPINGGTAPIYVWQKNGVNIIGGLGITTYTEGNLNNNDSVKCVISSINGCVTATSAVSNKIVETVNQKTVATVNITTTATNICAGTLVTFSATPSSNIQAPFYLWKKNNVNVVGSATSNTYADYNSFNNGDIITCTVSSACTIDATSNAITMNVTPKAPASVSITASATTITAGTKVTFTATPTLGAGTTPTYVWKKNGINMQGGVNATTYVTTALANGDTISCVMTSSNYCTADASSNNIVMKVTSAFTNASNQQTAGIAQARMVNTTAEQTVATIFPNPSNGNFKLTAQLRNSETQATKVQIINALGKVVAVYNTTAINGAINLQVNESSLSNGLYLVKYTAGNETGTTKLVVSK